MNITNDMWDAYRLTHPDHDNLSLEEAAEKMRVTEIQVMRMLCRIRTTHPDLFIDIISDGREFDYGVSRFDGWCEDGVVKKF